MALVHLGAPLSPAPMLLISASLLVLPFLRPGRALTARPFCAFGVAVIAGVIHGLAWERSRLGDCRFGLAEGQAVQVVGLVESVTPGGSRATVRVADGGDGHCEGRIRVVLPRLGGASERSRPTPASRVEVVGSWRRLSGASGDPLYAGELVAASIEDAAGSGKEGALLRQRARIEARVRRLWPERAGVVSALLLARKEGLTPELRSAFARSGTAHLLAISGFHVGVVAALLLAAVRALGVAARPARGWAALAVWAYVAFIGAPDAATRAALILTLFAAGAFAGRAVSREGALATALLLMVALDPGSLVRPGVQLSFCGVAGLVSLSAPLEDALTRRFPWRGLRRVLGPFAAALAATLFTLPVVAWHFDRVSVVGIPATLFSTPLVAAAIPGALAALAADVLSRPLGSFLAGAPDLLLSLLVWLTLRFGELPGAVVWVPRGWILASAAGVITACLLLSRATHLGRGTRSVVLLAAAAVGIALLPVGERIAARGTLEMLFLDVGQGDAILVRSPGSRWIMVDAGPPGDRSSRDAPPAMVWLRRQGVGRLEALLLTHAHLDHIGGAADLLRSVPVGVILDPGLPRGSDAFVEVLEIAGGEGRGWRAAVRGDHFTLDGVDVEVLHSLDPGRAGSGGDQVNENSLVATVRFGAFSALLTGDAPVAVEEDVAHALGEVDVLKVGHHGSRTSTSATFLRETSPAVAVISVGLGNLYGHPHEPVLLRLAEMGLDVYRTDQNGSIRVVARRDGSFTVRPQREADTRP